MTSGKDFRLKDHDPADTAGHLVPRAEADARLALGVEHLAALQEKLYAQDRWAMFCVFQAMDAAGKDGTIKHVMSGVNPQGVQVTSFKAPGPEELAHDFLWRAVRALPERGRIGIFNRSHYEEVLVVRVHPEFLERQHLPRELLGKKLWEQRLDAIAAFERHLSRQGTVVLKFFLHVSKAGAEAPLPRAAGGEGQALEVQRQRPGRARILGRLSARLSGGDRRHGNAGSAVVHCPGGQQVVHPADCRRGDDRGAGGAGPAHPGPDRSRRSCARGGTTEAGERSIGLRQDATASLSVAICGAARLYVTSRGAMVRNAPPALLLP